MLQSELKTQLKSCKIEGVYLFCGEEDYLKRYYIGQIRAKLLTDEAFETFNHIVFHGEEIDFDGLADAISAPPMMADKKLIEVYGTDFESMKESELESLEKIVSEVKDNPSSVVVFCAENEALIPGTPKRPTPLFKRLSELMNTVNLELSTDDKLGAWLNSHFAHEGLETGRDAIRTMIDRCGHSMDILASETEKLVCYAHAHGLLTINVETVISVCTPTSEDDAFGLTNAVLEGNIAGAYRKLSDLMQRRVDPMVIFGQISRLISDLVSVSCLLEEGTAAPEIASILSMNEYKAKLYIQSARRRSSEGFRNALSRCREIDLSIKRGADPVPLLDRLIVELAQK